MRFSLTSIVRLLLALGLLSGGTAITVSRLAPPPCRYRIMADTALAGLNGNFFPDHDPTTRLLDLSTGDCRKLEAQGGDEFEHASFSPWQDEQGESQVVGRWHRRMGRDGDMLCQQFGLARFTYPGGRVLDRIELDMVISGRPCWYPDTSARILFAAGDGRLYRLSFDDPRPSSGTDRDKSPKPSALSWRTPLPGDGLFIRDPAWPSDPRLGRKVIATLTFLDNKGGKRAYLPPQLWWLQFDPDTATIVRAGRLTRPDPSAEGDFECMPCVANSPDGTPLLAYLSHGQDGPEWEMRIVPITFEGPMGDPVARTSASVKVAERCAPSPPAFSADGRWVCGIVDPLSPRARVGRFSVVEALASATPSPILLASEPGTPPGR
jgi:hypothetical protein